MLYEREQLHAKNGIDGHHEEENGCDVEERGHSEHERLHQLACATETAIAD